MKKIISFSLWGNNPKYTIGAIKNCILQQEFYPKWTCRFYCDLAVPDEIIQKLQGLGSEIVIKNVIGDWRFAVERFRAIDDETSHVIFRDTDSRPTTREVSAVHEWIESGKTLHIMKDHPYHSGFPILAGMWGLKKEGFDLSMNDLLDIYNIADSHYHYDQVFLRDYIWKFYSHDCLIHGEIFGNKPFPQPRDGLNFVGQVFDENENTVKEHLKALAEHVR